MGSKPSKAKSTDASTASAAGLADNSKRREVVQKHAPAGNTRSYEYTTLPGYPGLPKHIRSYAFNAQKLDLFIRCFLRVNHLYDAQRLRHFDKHALESFQDYHDFINFGDLPPPLVNVPFPEFATTWRKDETFASNFIRGISPVVIVRASVTGSRSLPHALVTPAATWQKNVERINTFLAAAEHNPAVTLQSLLEAGRLFFADYELLSGIPASIKGTYFYAPIALLYHSERHQKLMPLGIQLERSFTQPWQNIEEASPNELFLPLVGEDENNEVLQRIWLFAKVHVMHADTLYHQNLFHLCFTHFCTETIIIACHRQFLTSHPIFQLLKEHFVGTLEINTWGRNRLLQDSDSFFRTNLSTGIDGSLKLMEKAYRNGYTLSGRALYRDLARRGFGADADPLPYYYYREDAARVWDILEIYCGDSVAAIYANDEAIFADVQLQSWLHELRSNGDHGASIPGVPEVRNRNDLTELLTTIIFTATAQHAAMNFGQYDFYAFQPFRPGTLTQPMPPAAERQAKFADDKYFVSALPTKEQLQRTVLNAYLLSLPTNDALIQDGFIETLTMLAPLSEHHSNPKVNEAWKVLHGSFEKLATLIRARATLTGIKYEYLIPTEIPRSIAI